MKKILLILLVFTLLVGCSTGNNADESKIEETTNEGSEEQTNEETAGETSSEAAEETKEDSNSGGEMELNQVAGYREGNIKAKMTTNMGEMELILFPNVAPKAVENFVEHAKNGYYEGITFHRVIEGFMIQGGDPTGTGSGGESIWNQDFEDEYDINYRNFYGALSMANAGPSTNGSQFFIVTAKNNVTPDIIAQMKEAGEESGYPESVINTYEEIGGAFHLDYRHTVFGHVVAGMDVAEAISKVERDGMDKPVEPVVIEKIEIEE